jgi:hypothetical protein
MSALGLSSHLSAEANESYHAAARAVVGRMGALAKPVVRHACCVGQIGMVGITALCALVGGLLGLLAGIVHWLSIRTR